MIIHVSTYPRLKLLEKEYPDDTTIQQVITEVASASDAGLFTDTPSLIVDKSILFMLIGEDDAVNRYYNGERGEIYRILDGSSKHIEEEEPAEGAEGAEGTERLDVSRYRIVSRLNVAKEKKKKERKDNAGLYQSAHETLLTMLEDRGCDPELVREHELTKSEIGNYYHHGDKIVLPKPESEPLINAKGKYVYAMYFAKGNEIVTSRSQVKFKQEHLVPFINGTAIDHYNKHNPEAPLDNIEMSDLSSLRNPVMINIASKLEIIMIYNNALGDTEKISIPYRFVQLYAVQDIAHNVTKHVDQPKHTLLNVRHNRDEIREMYSLNGRTLDPTKKLSYYNLRKGTRLFMI